MISRAQQILIKRAQKEAGLSDADYRDAIETVTGFRTTKAPGLTDHHVDLVLGYFEAIHWRAVDAGQLQPSCKPDAVFRQRGYWKAKNPKANTSRDRYAAVHPGTEITELESAMAALGFGLEYCATIRQRATDGADDARALFIYKRALERTLSAKQAKQTATADPL